MKHLYPWLTDTHLDSLYPWQRYRFWLNIKKDKPKGVFLTGDICNGLFIYRNLKQFAKLGCPIYMVNGNHHFHWSSFEKVYGQLERLSKEFPNFKWLDRIDEPLPLEEGIAVIGADGFYDAAQGDTKWLKYTFDWLLIKEFRKMPSMVERIQAFRQIAEDSCRKIEERLVRALDAGYETIFILTHYPPWLEATRDKNTLMEKFWLPYNSNIGLGKTIEKVMEGRKKKRVCVLSGHTHSEVFVRISNSIEAQVGSGNYVNGIPYSQKIYL